MKSLENDGDLVHIYTSGFLYNEEGGSRTLSGPEGNRCGDADGFRFQLRRADNDASRSKDPRGQTYDPAMSGSGGGESCVSIISVVCPTISVDILAPLRPQPAERAAVATLSSDFPGHSVPSGSLVDITEGAPLRRQLLQPTPPAVPPTGSARRDPTLEMPPNNLHLLDAKSHTPTPIKSPTQSACDGFFSDILGLPRGAVGHGPVAPSTTPPTPPTSGQGESSRCVSVGVVINNTRPFFHAAPLTQQGQDSFEWMKNRLHQLHGPTEDPPPSQMTTHDYSERPTRMAIALEGSRSLLGRSTDGHKRSLLLPLRERFVASPSTGTGFPAPLQSFSDARMSKVPSPMSKTLLMARLQTFRWLSSPGGSTEDKELSDVASLFSDDTSKAVRRSRRGLSNDVEDDDSVSSISGSALSLLSHTAKGKSASLFSSVETKSSSEVRQSGIAGSAADAVPVVGSTIFCVNAQTGKAKTRSKKGASDARSSIDHDPISMLSSWEIRPQRRALNFTEGHGDQLNLSSGRGQYGPSHSGPEISSTAMQDYASWRGRPSLPHTSNSESSIRGSLRHYWASMRSRLGFRSTSHRKDDDDHDDARQSMLPDVSLSERPSTELDMAAPAFHRCSERQKQQVGSNAIVTGLPPPSDTAVPLSKRRSVKIGALSTRAIREARRTRLR